MEPGFMGRLERLRTIFGKPMRVASGYRCPVHNAAVSATGQTGPHTTGRAVDIALWGADALVLVRMAVAHGFTGVGVSQKGPRAGRFVHIDDLADGAPGPRPWLWSY